jgi:hypothetical protein
MLLLHQKMAKRRGNCSSVEAFSLRALRRRKRMVTERRKLRVLIREISPKEDHHSSQTLAQQVEDYLILLLQV